MDIKGVLQLLDGESWASLAVVKANEHRGVAGEILRLVSHGFVSHKAEWLNR